MNGFSKLSLKRHEFIAAVGDRQYDLQSDQSQAAENPLCGWRYGETADVYAQVVRRPLL
jgi:hypothetical protein